MSRRAFAGIALAAFAAGAALPAQAANRPPAKVVTIHDNFYLPLSLKVKKDTMIKWKWPNDAGDLHDVKLKTKPKGAKRFASDPAAVGYTYKQRLTVPGRYHIICTLHEEMVMDIVVRKPRR